MDPVIAARTKLMERIALATNVWRELKTHDVPETAIVQAMVFVEIIIIYVNTKIKTYAIINLALNHLAHEVNGLRTEMRNEIMRSEPYEIRTLDQQFLMAG